MARLTVSIPTKNVVRSVADWAESHILIPARTPKPGPLRLTAPQRAILEAYSDPTVNQITLMTGNQLGKSLILLSILGYHIAEFPRSILLVMPTIEVRTRFLREKFTPLVDSTPVINQAIKRTERGAIPSNIIEYDRGEIHTGYSGSASSLESVTAQLVVADEVDTYRLTQDGRHPIDSMRARSTAFGSTSKLVLASTPTRSPDSLIAREFERGSASEWYVPCVHCGDIHMMEWEHVGNADDEDRFGKLYCPSCSHEVTDHERILSIEHGHYVDENDNPTHKSFHLSQMYSPLMSVRNKAEGLRDGAFTMRGFQTTVLGLPYSPNVLEELTEDDLAMLYHEDYSPERVSAITASVDVQKDRLEYQIVQWSRMFPRILKHEAIGREVGDKVKIWRKLAKAIAPYNPDQLFVDVGAYTEEVRAAVNRGLRRFALQRTSTGSCLRLIRGSTRPDYDGDQSGDLVLKERNKRYPYDLWLNTNTAKEILNDWMANGEISIDPNGVPDDFSEQLLSEELRRIVKSNGTEGLRWVRKGGVRNEALDCLVYNLCARHYLGPQFDREYRMNAIKAQMPKS